MDSTNIDHYDVLWCINKRRIDMMSNEDQLITVGFIVGFAAGVVAMIITTNCY